MDWLVFQKNLADLYYVGFERIQDALEIYLKLLEASPKDVEILLIIGNICTSLKKFDEANVFYTCVLEVDPKNELARRNLLLIDQISQKATRKVPAEQMYSDIRPLMEGADYEKVIEASGGYGEKVETPADLLPALERALDVIGSENRSALLNVQVHYSDDDAVRDART